MKMTPIIAKMIPITAQDQMRNLLDSLNRSKGTHVSTKELLKKNLWNEWISYWIMMHNNSFNFGISLELKIVIGSTPLHCVEPRGFNYVTTSSHCTMRLSMKIKETKILKSKNSFYAHFWTKTGDFFLKRWKTTNILPKIFFQVKNVKKIGILGQKNGRAGPIILKLSLKKI